MRSKLPDLVERGRIKKGKDASDVSFGPYGMFVLRYLMGDRLLVQAAGAAYPETEGWEHVSVSALMRTPHWEEMAWVKNLFWEPEELVVQFHVPTSEHINCHPFCLHLWRHVSIRIPTPPAWLIGVKDAV